MPDSYSEISCEQSVQFLVCTYAVCNHLCSDVQTVRADGAGGIHNCTRPRLQVMAIYERDILFVTRGTLPVLPFNAQTTLKVYDKLQIRLIGHHLLMLLNPNCTSSFFPWFNSTWKQPCRLIHLFTLIVPLGTRQEAVSKQNTTPPFAVTSTIVCSR